MPADEGSQYLNELTLVDIYRTLNLILCENAKISFQFGAPMRTKLLKCNKVIIYGFVFLSYLLFSSWLAQLVSQREAEWTMSDVIMTIFDVISIACLWLLFLNRFFNYYLTSKFPAAGLVFTVSFILLWGVGGACTLHSAQAVFMQHLAGGCFLSVAFIASFLFISFRLACIADQASNNFMKG